MNEQEFLQVRKMALQKYFSRMNPQQFDAVTTINGAVLVLAGAGSGKTTVIINRIANMVLFGDTLHQLTPVPNDSNLQKLQNYIHGNVGITLQELQNFIAVRPVNPWQILAITFTNKAAEELKNRLAETLGENAQNVWASTFHSACVRILRTCSERVGYANNFTIYDTDDSLKLLKSCMKEMKISEKNFLPKDILSSISHAKDSMIAPEKYVLEFGNDYFHAMTGKIYQSYQNQLQEANAMDFDDLIYLTVRIFENNPDILEKYQNKFRYLMVDEYQDTNHAQYRLVSLLAEKYGNLCVVGDDDQSIYSFRGATIENILNFEKQFKQCRVIKLEENYRSTRNILNTANDIISHNEYRKKKKLRTSGEDGELVYIVTTTDEKLEAQFIVDKIQKGIIQGKHYADFVVLYRMNALSNYLEKAFVRSHIPYRIYGGIRFQDRKEIKDILAYLTVLVNPFDSVRFERVINVPKRGIGVSTTVAITQIASDLHISPIEVVQNCQNFPVLSRRVPALLQFAYLMEELQQKISELPLEEFFDFMLDKTGYLAMLEQDDKDGEERIENVKEFRSNIVDYVRLHENPTLEGFLEEMALYTDSDKESGQDTVSMMTMHAAKGLEFDTVFAVGMEENIFPSARSAFEKSELEEERRLAYVTVTRAKRCLYLLHAKSRLVFGDFRNNETSRFLNEISAKYVRFQQCLVGGITGAGSLKRLLSGVPEEYTYIGETTSVKQTPEKPVFSSQDIKTPVSNTLPSAGNLNQVFAVGERIHDKIFGDGSILRAEAISNDWLLEIAFDQIGTKKLMARYRQITKL